MRLILAIAAAVLVTAAPAAAAPAIHAHRGGSLVNGKPTYAENTLPAFRHAARLGFVLELDVKLTKDRIPMVIHDDSLDRTTACRGLVASRTLAQLRRCPSDILGTTGRSVRTKRRTPIPTLAQALALAKRERASVNLEIKNLPTDKDFDKTDAYANRVCDVIKASGLPRSRLIVQSFIPANLEVAKRRLPGVALSQLATSGFNDGAIDLAANEGAKWVSPQFPIDADYVQRAHAKGLKVVPFTLDKATDLRAAAAAGVDALITNDPVLAKRTLASRR